MIQLHGKVALITGASHGIGRACAELLAEAGATVVVNFLKSADAARAIVDSIHSRGGQAIAVRADVSSNDDVHAMVDVVKQQFGRLDVVVSNAAAGGFRPLMNITPASFDSVLNMNAAPVIWLTQAARQLLQAGEGPGKVIAISSHGSMRGIANYGAIGASKAALESLVRHLAFELGRAVIYFNAVLPGIVSTDAIKTFPGSEGMLQSVKQQILVKDKMVQPRDVAGAVVFLASPLSDLIQGHVMVLDGGISIRV